MEANIKQVSEQLKKRLEAAKNSAEVEQIRVEFLGKKGQITELLKNLKDVKGDAKRELGQSINALKKQAEADIEKAQVDVAAAEQQLLIDNAEQYDVTLPAQAELGSYPDHIDSKRGRGDFCEYGLHD